jgi:hypothetical protein
MKIFIKIIAIILLGIVMLNLSIYVFNIIDAWTGILSGLISIIIFIYLCYKTIINGQN